MATLVFGSVVPVAGRLGMARAVLCRLSLTRSATSGVSSFIKCQTSPAEMTIPPTAAAIIWGRGFGILERVLMRATPSVSSSFLSAKEMLGRMENELLLNSLAIMVADG